MKLIKLIIYLLTLLGFLLIGCQKDDPFNRNYFIIDGWISTDQYLFEYGCYLPGTSPHLTEFVYLNGKQPAEKTDYVYDLDYDQDFYCETSEPGEDLEYFEGYCSNSKKMALEILFDEGDYCYITSKLKAADGEAIANDLNLIRTNGLNSIVWPWVHIMGMLHMGFGSNLTSPPFTVGKIDNLGADELTISGRDTIYYNWNIPEHPINMIREWHIELEAQ